MGEAVEAGRESLYLECPNCRCIVRSIDVPKAGSLPTHPTLPRWQRIMCNKGGGEPS